MYTTLKTLNGSFITDPDRWLGHSDYFESLFSGKWGDKKEDGSYFIETDGHVFEHILRHLRTGVLPIFYDSTEGHDFVLYNSLLGEAQYFGIDRLCKWLCKRRYLDAVKIHYIACETRDRSSYFGNTTVSDLEGRKIYYEGDKFVEITAGGQMEISMRPITQQRNVFYCPNGKHGKSNEEYCRSCFVEAADRKVKGVGGWRNEEILMWCIVRKEIVFDHDLCANAFREEEEA